MRLLLIGYGKMGKTIEQIALKRGHTVPYIIDMHNQADIKKINGSMVDAAIEFTQPESAFENIKHCIENNIPVASGTTGWLDRKPEIEQLCKEKDGTFFYASNYSVGVNIFFHLNKILAKIMNGFPQYTTEMEEIHHTEKKDSPSGTAITLAEGLLANFDAKKKWVNEKPTSSEQLEIISKRIENVPGTHTVFYNSEVDTIEIKHTAHNRHGFAEGAVVAAEWIQSRKGILGMDDMIKINF